ncbi:tRNA-splicing endonuclease subunit sen54 N-term [Carex littledalei]|uniref:tRNA-splicing endonuclease subunit sen54 N-term n=1 Tax=Carex littledalei TaxID=544730 RepID=A0A833QUU3_9POAL|nr:tRNA-splicing endonuclease subunit sen54 N-term [Carex littledalei]
MASPSAPFPQATLMHSGRNFSVEEQAALDGEVCKMEGETRRRRKGKERAVNQERNQQQKNFFLEDESEEHHFNPFLPSSPNSSNSSLPKTQIRTEVSRARWMEEIGMGEVMEKKGSLWGTTGVIRNSKLYCHIEEIGFLAQIGALVLLDEGDNIMDLKDIFRKCANKRYGCTWDSFEAYRHLKSLGYVVGRHGQPWSLKLDKVNSNSDFTADTDPDLIAGRVEELHIGAANLIFDIHRPNSRFKKTDPGVPSFVICLVGDRPPSRKEVEDLEKRCKSVPLKFCHVNHDNVSFFSLSKVSLPVLP